MLLVDVNPLGLDVQLYVWPLVELAPILVDDPLQIAVADTTVADGKGLTVIFTESDLLQPVAVIVSVTVYVVVVLGETLGLLLVDVNPLGLEVQL